MRNDSVVNSRPLDVHRWSDFLEVNTFVDELWLQYRQECTDVKGRLRGRPPKQVKRDQFKVLILDLYVCWIEDPEQYLGINLANRHWHPDSRYNALHLSRNIRLFLAWLVDKKYVERRPHLYHPSNPSLNYCSRFRASPSLIAHFERVGFTTHEIGTHSAKELIILRDDDQEKLVELEYQDTDTTNSMRSCLQSYNALLDVTHIDIATLDRPVVSHIINKGPQIGEATLIHISQNNKNVKRIFSRNSWDAHGRIYGGWWQQIGKTLRRDIFIQGNPTVEVDFKALHISLLLCKTGEPTALDPYTLNKQIFPEINAATQRRWMKRLVLCAINARTKKAAFSAFRYDSKLGTIEKHLKDKELDLLLKAFIETYPKLEPFICNDQGIHLMHIDGNITAFIIDQLTSQSIPVLTIHDSYIVQRHHFSALRQAMILGSLKYARRNLLAVQDGFDIDLNGSWAITNEKAVNKLPKIDPTATYKTRLRNFCYRKGIKLKRANDGRGLMSRDVFICA